MYYSDGGYKFTESHEGLRLQAYRDTGGVWTIGYGHTKGVKEGDVITAQQADQYLHMDIAEAVMSVNNLVKIPITQNQFDALVDFCFNVGTKQFAGSTLLKLLNSGDYVGAAAQFKRWNLDNGKVIAGLVARRQDEADLFLHK